MSTGDATGQGTDQGTEITTGISSPVLALLTWLLPRKAVDWIEDHAERLQLLVLTIMVVSFAWMVERKIPGTALLATLVAFICIIVQSVVTTGAWTFWSSSNESAEMVQEVNDGGFELEQDEDDELQNLDSIAAGGLADHTAVKDAPIEDPPAVGSTEPMCKARLELLVRYMASMEAKGQEPAPTPQRQKLQRKLLLRNAGATKSAHGKSQVADAPSALSPAEAAHPEAVEMSEKQIEELISEIGATETVVTGRSGRHHTPKRAPKRRGCNSNRSIAKFAVGGKPQAELRSPIGVDPTPSPPEPKPDVDPEVGTDNDDDLLVEEPAGFQVVENRKARRKQRRHPHVHREVGNHDDDGLACEPSDDVDAKEEGNIPSISSAGALPSTAPSRGACGVDLQPHEDQSDPHDAGVRGVLETGDEEEEWEWQCPAGNLLEPYQCPNPMMCSSCGQVQNVGAKVLWSHESQWVACEECVRLAWEQPMEVRCAGDPAAFAAAEHAGDADEVTALEPSKMTALQIAEWFKENGAEEELRHCMRQVISARTVGMGVTH